MRLRRRFTLSSCSSAEFFKFSVSVQLRFREGLNELRSEILVVIELGDFGVAVKEGVMFAIDKVLADGGLAGMDWPGHPDDEWPILFFLADRAIGGPAPPDGNLHEGETAFGAGGGGLAIAKKMRLHRAGFPFLDVEGMDGRAPLLNRFL